MSAVQNIQDVEVKGYEVTVEHDVDNDLYLKIDGQEMFLYREEADALAAELMRSTTPVQAQPSTATLTDRVEAIEQRLGEVLAASDEPEPVNALDVRGILESYIRLQVPVVIEYQKLDGEQVTRRVSPHEVNDSVGGRAFLVGYDHERGGVRNFRVARIYGVGPAAERYHA